MLHHKILPLKKPVLNNLKHYMRSSILTQYECCSSTPCHCATARHQIRSAQAPCASTSLTYNLPSPRRASFMVTEPPTRPCRASAKRPCRASMHNHAPPRTTLPSRAAAVAPPCMNTHKDRGRHPGHHSWEHRPPPRATPTVPLREARRQPQPKLADRHTMDICTSRFA